MGVSVSTPEMCRAKAQLLRRYFKAVAHISLGLDTFLLGIVCLILLLREK